MKWQTKANALRPDQEDPTGGESRLELYQEKQPYHEVEASGDLPA